MEVTTILKDGLKSNKYESLLLDIYVDEDRAKAQVGRYINAINEYEKYYGVNQVSVFSAPGRSEIGGNHTDHQHGEILAASINLDAIAIVRKTDDGIVKVISEGYDEIVIDTNNIELLEENKGTTKALIMGVLAGAKDKGFAIGGFESYITSEVLIGAGLSSSAAFETVIGTIISHLYNEGKLDAVTNAIIGQYAENVYFGKPCGLMDQMACSVGSLVHVDFKNPKEPLVEKVEFDMNGHGYSLCITDTKGSHADLTDDYAAIPKEMKQVAACFNKEVLVGISMDDILGNIENLRNKCGDRAVLRAIHFVCENERVKAEVEALREDNVEMFLENVKASGNSSYKYLQNVYADHDVTHQNVSLALAVSDIELAQGKGVSRVHGGGFAGTIQAFVKNEQVENYQKTMNKMFGEGSCHVLQIRKYGGMKVL